jgi:ABC-2 type transport system permease protein
MSEGVVFDLGYRPHEGERLGRAGAVRALYRDGVRRVFGVRRRARRKIFPAILIGLAVLPALFFVAIGVVLGDLGTDAFFDHPQYFNWTGNITLIFCALAASELIIPDRIHGTMAVYASRPLKAIDYVGARATSMAVVVFGFVWVPHLLLLIGRAWTSDNGFGDFLTSNLDVLWQTALATLVYIVAYGALAFMVAVYSSRPALAIVVFLITLAAWRATVEALVSAGYDIAALAAIPDHPGYVKDWIMGANSEAWLPETAGYGPFLSLVVIMAIGAIAAVAVVRRYRSEL